MAADAASKRPTIAGVVVLREDGAALLQLRDDIPTIQDPGIWVIPGGHVNLDESPSVGAAREVEEETCYRCTQVRPLAQCRGVELGYDHDFDLFFFWENYDGRQPVECREGQAVAFVPRAEAERLPRRSYLTEIWDLALAARKAANAQ